jgi:hypothetical protein
VADVIDIRTGRPVRDLDAMLATRDRPMTELEVVLVRFGVAIAEREKQRRASAQRPTPVPDAILTPPSAALE